MALLKVICWAIIYSKNSFPAWPTTILQPLFHSFIPVSQQSIFCPNTTASKRSILVFKFQIFLALFSYSFSALVHFSNIHATVRVSSRHSSSSRTIELHKTPQESCRFVCSFIESLPSCSFEDCPSKRRSFS